MIFSAFLYISRNETRRAAKDGDSRFTLGL